MRRIFLILLFCSALFAQNPYRIFNSFNAGELSPLLNAREDLSKYQSGCSVMENLIPIPQGGAQKRPGTKYIAEVKTSSLKTRIIPFEFSTSQSYIIEVGNQYMRFFTNSAAINTGAGTETLPSGNIVAHWLLNDTLGTNVLDDDGETHNGTATVDTSTLNTAGKVGTGSFDLDGQYTVTVTDSDDFSFDDSGTNPFSIVCWGYVTRNGLVQVLVSKWDETTGAEDREWRFSLGSDRKLQFHLSDDSINLTGDMIGQWKLNDALGDTVVVDTAGTQNGVASQITSSFTTTGKIDKAFNFDGTNDYVRVADNAAYDFTGAFSIAVWVKASALGVNWVVSRYDGSSKDGYHINIAASNKWQFSVNVNSGIGESIYSNDEVMAGQWYFIVATRDGSGNMKMYVNSVLQTDTDTNSGAIDSTSSLYIGERWNEESTWRWNGEIDNVVLFNIALTQSNVTNLYNSNIGTESLAAALPNAISDDVIVVGWHFFCVTYNSAGGSAAADGIILYVDGATVSSAKINETSYVAMENTAALVRLGAQESIGGSNEAFWADKIDEIAIFSDVLTPAEITTLYSSALYEITTPYLTADLFNLKFEQSADVLYITHPDYETRKLSRLTNAAWQLKVIDIQSGPFRTQNSDVIKTITADGTTGSVTLTAIGHTPFISGTTAGYLPSGSISTSKSQTGALFKLVHPIGQPDYTDTFTVVNDFVDCGTLFLGGGWALTTENVWRGTVKVQRNYTIGAAWNASGWETVATFLSGTGDGVGTEKNFTTTGTEDYVDADYQVIYTTDWGGTVEVLFDTDQTDQIGIVEITAVASATSATGTVIKTLGSTDATHKWSEGSWSNYRGWPQTVTFFEDRLMFGGNTAQPDTIWGSVTSDYENMTAGAEDDDAVVFTLTSRQVNVIEWIIGKDKILIGTSGAEWTLEGGADEPLTPSNVIAKQHSTYGSANIQATLANESVLFFQRGKEKMRELAYNWELDSYVAPDMTILSNLITDSGIDDTAFQKIPDSILWCVRNDGELPIFSYERAENITAWSRMVTQTNLAGTLTDSDFESVARISGSPEDEVWVIVERVIDSNTVRYIEQFQPRDFGDAEDAFFVDCGATYTTDVNVISDLDWLEGETVSVLADGDDIGTFTISSDTITLGGVYQTVQVGLLYEVHLRTMPLSMVGETTIHGKQKRISEVVAEWYKSGDFSIGKDADTLQTYSISGQTTSLNRKTFPPGYSRQGYIYVYQQSPEPLTLLSIMAEFSLR